MNQKYDHYIAVDWALSNMAIARATRHDNEINCVEVVADISDLKAYLSHLKGTKLLCFEESTPAQWLYVELKEFVDEIIVCDPYRNKLLSEGAKTDKIDAIKLLKLMRAGLLKPVYHSSDELISLRKIINGYLDVVYAGVRVKNQRSALLRGYGLNRDEDLPNPSDADLFVMQGYDLSIKNYEEEKLRYNKKFISLGNDIEIIKNLKSVPGIGPVGAVKVAAIVVDPKRFTNKSQWLSYCGLVMHDRISGGKLYGKKTPRHSRILKSVFKTAAITILQDQPTIYTKALGDSASAIKSYYQLLMERKNYPPHRARAAVARKIATIALGVMKSQKKFDDRWRKKYVTSNIL